MKFVSFIFLGLLVLVGCSGEDRLRCCGYESDIKPMYKPKQIRFEAIPVTLTNSIDATRIKPDPVRKGIHKVIGGIPIVGDVMELPIDLLTALIQFPIEDKMQMPTDGPWNDPRILPLVQSARISAAYLEIVPEDERGPDYEKRSCWLGLIKCGESLKFIDEMYINLVFPDPANPTLDKNGESAFDEAGKEIPGEAHFPILSSIKKINYNKDKEIINFQATDVDLIPLIKKYGNNFHVKLFAKGKAPKREVFVRGGITIEIVLQLPPVY